MLRQPPEGLSPFYIGDGTFRTLLFVNLEADVMVMTMPDLQTYHIKRSPHGVHYVYVHHSIVSCHMIYRPAAFDHFDTIFCVGPHHEQEIRAREQQAGLPPKTLVEHGYGRLETLMDELEKMADTMPAAQDDQPHVLVAPSWGDHALLERLGVTFVAPLLEAGFRVTLRPHPRTRQLHSRVLDDAEKRFADHASFTLDEDVASRRSLIEADVMVSDWSGAALEFAFAREQPVLFVDVPRKVNNPGWDQLGIEPLEAWIRDKIGVVVPKAELDSMPNHIGSLIQESASYSTRIRQLRSEYVHNLGESGRVGACHLMDILKKGGASEG